MLLGAAIALGAGCTTTTQVKDIQNYESKRQAWVGPWAEIAEAHDNGAQARLNKGLERLPILDLHTAEHLTLSSFRVTSLDRVPLRAGASVLIAIEGEGLLESAEGKAQVRPGTVVVLPTGTGVTLSSPETLRAISFGTPTVGAEEGWQVLDVKDFPVATSPPGGVTEWARVEGALSLRALSIFPLGGLQPHTHLVHDTSLLILSGEGVLGLGSETHGESSGTSRGDRKLKRSFVASPVTDQAVICLPAGSVHGFTAEGRQQVLALQVFGPDFDGRDGVVIPERQKASGSK